MPETAGGVRGRYDRAVPGAAQIDEIASELDSWPGVHIERRADGPTLVRYEHLELGLLDRDRGLVELRFPQPERDELIERGDAEAASSMPDSVSHAVRGPADVSAALELFGRRYRDLRGEDDPYTSQDPA
jgi:luciferase-like monooxygenase